MYKKVPIFRCTTPSTGKRLEEFEVVVGTLYCIMYQRRLQIPLTSSLLMVLYTEISELFCTSFRLALVSKILLKTLSECESRIVGRSPNYEFLDISCTKLIWFNAKVNQIALQG